MYGMTSASEGPVFGAAPAGAVCHPRRAAYAVIVAADGRVAAIRATLSDGSSRYWLPGGGLEAGESPAQAVEREVREELGRGVCVEGELGEALQYFYAGDEGRWYEMKATFFRAVFDDTPAPGGEYELHWLHARDDASKFFHACHAWAASLA